MAKRKSKRPSTARAQSTAQTFTEIDGSPVAGLKLRHVLRGHHRPIGRISWAPNGAYLASPSDDKTTRIWDVRSGACIHTLKVDIDVADVAITAWAPDSRLLASASKQGAISLWDVESGKLVKILKGHTESVCALAWSPAGRLASVAEDKTIRLWDDEKGEVLTELTSSSFCLAWSPDGQSLAVSPYKVINLINVANGQEIQRLSGHSGIVWSIAWMPDGQRLASASFDQTIRLWDTETGKAIREMEGHSNTVNCLALSGDGRWLISKGSTPDDTVRLWNCETGACVAVLPEPSQNLWVPGIAFHPHLAWFATLGERDTIIRIWELDEALLSGRTESVLYTTAKIVLVGDSGVGKTGLGWRLAHNEFKEHASTHGQQFWPIQALGLKRKDGTECEAVLWDLAGQHVYRPIHSIFLENVAAALVLFDPSNRQEPLKGVQFWLEQLKGKGKLPPTVLIGGRLDRGAPAVSQQELEQFCQRYGISGGYLGTSALKGEGIDKVLEALRTQILWDEITATVTTITFKRIKDYVLELKEKPDRTSLLVSPSTLREQLQAIDQDWSFTDAEMMTAVGHLETHGYVAVLRSSSGEQHILLRPELLVMLASSIVLLADKHPRELGAISETELLQGRYTFDELSGMSALESQILLDAGILRFLEHNICFRETLNDETLLIFPGLIKQKRPLQDDLPSTDDISYIVRGRVENLYASLVVLLGYTPSFTRINQWQNQAQYEMRENEICGFRLIEDREGEIEVVLYYGQQFPPPGREQFQALFEQFLYQRDVEVTRFPPVECPQLHRQERATIVKRVREGKRFVHCEECGARTDLPNLEQEHAIGISASPWLQREEAAARLRSTYEVQLTKVKAYRRDWAAPRCYVSRVNEDSNWTSDLIKDLRDAGVYVVDEPTRVQKNDVIVVVDSTAYQRAFKSGTAVLAADLPLINARLGKKQVISLALSGKSRSHEFKNCQVGSFCDQTHYPVSLFDLVLTLYAIPLTYAGFAPLRQTLHSKWEETLGHMKDQESDSPLRIFISYSHEDEEFKDELVTMLASLQRRGVVDTWQDRRIEAGDEWNQSILDAMDQCDLALLLVSPDYLASRFIQEEEQPRLLERRREMRVRVIPIVLRACPWDSEPVLKELQALPKDAKPIITFSKDTGARDQVWTDIAKVIEKHAKVSASRR